MKMNTRFSWLPLPMAVKLFLMAGMWMSLSLAATAQPAAIDAGNPVLYPSRIEVEPVIDGILDENIWKTTPLEVDFLSYSPIYGEKLPEKTLVWMAYDSKNLYFAFKCFDSEPQKIKTSTTGRDSMYRDDWVGLSLDAQ